MEAQIKQPTTETIMKYKQNLRIDGNKVFSYSTHVATIDSANRRLLVHGWWSVTTSKHINHVADTYRLSKVMTHSEDKDSQSSDSSGLLRSVAMVAKLGELLCPTQKEQNDWKVRMMKAGLENRGLNMPENWDQLTEAEKTKRLDGAIAAIA